MEIIYLILGTVIGGILVFLLTKSNSVNKKNFDEANEKLIRAQENELNHQQKIEELKLSNLELMKENALIQKSKEELLFTNAELNAHYKNLQDNLENQKEDFVKLQETNRLQFEKTANQILEQKSEKFTQLNQNQLKLILEPFQEKINELKNTVNETYDKESKERFSLGEKVRELKDLNQQISEDAKKLTRALKGESKTQGNWGEMILESILEKSGLRKNQEYFMEHELRDENNKAIFSEFSGKKMRPDAVVKYPDNRNVIIDSKVSLTAFVEMTDETDAEIFTIKQNQHLQSVKNHILQLSQKAYDDFDKSLDFVMMFVPSEAAYMTALQTDPNLWNFAYDKRILLLSPTNLITSLKLVQDLWKREHQNRNAMEIADRGAKLYDKFVGFVDNLERVGKNIDQAKNSYNEAFKQLSSGNDNLIIQTQKLKSLGIKNKKNLPQGLGEED
ncbi:DNA recombination protein RmuC [compost metagenome]